MSRPQALLAGISAAAALALSASQASAAPPSDPGCEGQFIKEGNQFFGFLSPSGNPEAASGFGFSWAPHAGQDLQTFRAEECPGS
jgi:hypothetical protein